jgi:hypothetical protein
LRNVSVGEIKIGMGCGKMVRKDGVIDGGRIGKDGVMNFARIDCDRKLKCFRSARRGIDLMDKTIETVDPIIEVSIFGFGDIIWLWRSSGEAIRCMASACDMYKFEVE